ncbi:hypothetical protein KSP39_PZI023807 [Platanthera zijinensis]|uniref:Uncharacterized protein n=1 Tax=Platanthera zijinensis TaxID=2320716 RepID=A0AAP0FT30_9ASPA
METRKRRLLQSCGNSFLVMARRACGFTKNLGGPLGLLVRSLSAVVSPTLYQVEHRCLLTLSFVDERILAATEDFAVAIYPPSATLFKGLDTLTLLVESAPKKFDDSVEFMTEFLCEIPPVNLVMKRFLKCKTEEEINAVDLELTSALPEKSEGERWDKVAEVKKPVSKCEEVIEAEEKEAAEEREKNKMKGGEMEDESAAILELFDVGWQARPLGGFRRA